MKIWTKVTLDERKSDECGGWVVHSVYDGDLESSETLQYLEQF